MSFNGKPQALAFVELANHGDADAFGLPLNEDEIGKRLESLPLGGV